MPASFKTGYADMAIESWGLFDRLQQAGVIPAKRQIPDQHPDADRADLQQHGAGRPAQLLPALTQAFVGEVTKIARRCRTTASRCNGTSARRCWRGRTTTSRDRSTSASRPSTCSRRSATRCRPAIELGYHLCYGSPADEHMVQPKDTGIMVEMANAIVAGVARPIQFFHMPVPKGRTDDAYFAPLEAPAARRRDRALSRPDPP